jgi:hypothetical protein
MGIVTGMSTVVLIVLPHRGQVKKNRAIMLLPPQSARILSMDKNSPESQDIMVDKDRFDAVLRKIISTKPLPLKDVIGTSPRRKRAEPAS